MRKPIVGAMIVATASLGVAVAHGSGPAAVAAKAKVTVPNEHCKRLDIAENAVSSHGLRFVERGGGTFGIIVKGDWVVSTQIPKAGKRVARGSKVYLYAAREC